MIFAVNVERWRATVQESIGRLRRNCPVCFSSTDRLGVTNAVLVDIVLAIIAKESSGNPNAVGDNGNSLGLMQLNYGAGTPQGMGFTEHRERLFDPQTNIYYGVKYFLNRLNKYGDVNKAILAYNAGSVRLRQGVPINQSYLDGVLAFLKVPIDYFASLSEKKNSPAPDSSSPSDSEPISSSEASASGSPTGIIVGAVCGSIVTLILTFVFQSC